MTDQQKAELAALAAMPEDEIDTSDIPEIPTDWANAKRGVFYGPVKRQITLWLEDLDAGAQGGPIYQALINHALREYIQRQRSSEPA